MYYLLGSKPLGYSQKTNSVVGITLHNYYDWRIKWFYRDGGIKKDWFFGMEDQPIKSIDFEQNKKLLGNATIEFTNVDFLIHSNDIVEIYQNSTKIYRGLVDSNVDAKKGKIKLIPIHQQLDERLVNYSFVNQTISSMIQTIVENLEDCDIIWDDDLINTGDSSLYTITFNYVTAKKAIEDLIKKLNGREYGVDVNNKFNIYLNSTSSINKIIFNAEDKWYSDLDVETNDDRIGATRYEVFVKSTESGKMTRIGNVGYDIAGNTYETLTIEKTKRRKDSKFEISANLNSTFALDLAYQDLQNQAKLSQTIKLNNFRINKYDPKISNYLKCVDDFEKVLSPLMSSSGIEITNTASNWTNATLFVDDFVEGSGSIQFLGSNPSNSAGYYDFMEIKRYPSGIDKLVFMIKSDQEIGEVYEMGLSNNTSSLFNNPYSIFIKESDLWEMKTINVTETSFRYIGFRLKNARDNRRQFNLLGRNMLGAYAQPALFTIFWIDDIKIYTWERATYYGNVVQKSYKINNQGVNCDIVLNDYSLQDSQTLFDLQKEVEKIKEIQKE